LVTKKSKLAEEAAWYFIEQNSKGNLISQTDAAQKFGIRTGAVKSHLKLLKKEFGLKSSEVFF